MTPAASPPLYSTPIHCHPASTTCAALPSPPTHVWPGVCVEAAHPHTRVGGTGMQLQPPQPSTLVASPDPHDAQAAHLPHAIGACSSHPRHANRRRVLRFDVGGSHSLGCAKQTRRHTLQSVSAEHAGGVGCGPLQYQQAVLAVAATWAKTDPMFLKRRSRRRWWKRGVYPRVPGDTVEQVSARA